jgi:hypothetical protein
LRTQAVSTWIWRERPMPKWKKDAKEFTVAVHHNEASGYYTTSIPKPVIDYLGKGIEVESVTYLIRGSKVEMRRSQE